MEALTATLSPLETAPCTRNESLGGTTTWVWKPVTERTWHEPSGHSYIYVSLLICVLGVTGNGLLIWFLLFCVKRKPFTVYLLHLAAADFLVLLCSSVFQLVTTLHVRDATLLNYVVLLLIFGYNTGLHLLTAISVERCLSVLFPIWYQCRRPRHQSAAACALLWALSVLVSGLENFFCIMEDEPRFPHCRYVYIFSSALTFLVFVPLMVFSNLVLFIQVCCKLKPRQPARLYVIIMATVLLFLAFAMPMKVLLITIYYSDASDRAVWRFLPYLNVLSTVNCSVNPIVYVVVGSLWRKTRGKSLKEALQKLFEEKPPAGSGDSGAQASPTSVSFH